MKVTPLFIEMEIEERIHILSQHREDVDVRTRMEEYTKMHQFMSRYSPDVAQFLAECKRAGGEWGKFSEYLKRRMELYG